LLISQFNRDDIKFTYIFDNDSKKHGDELIGEPIIDFNFIKNKIEEYVDAIVISSLASENYISEELIYLKDHGIKVFRLYSQG
jgi:hypothetical protein